MKHFKVSLIGLFSVLFISATNPETRTDFLLYQSADDNWTRPINLAHGREGQSLFPTLIADESGGLHLFWDEVIEVPGGTERIVDYAFWDGISWSEPIDVFAGVRGQMALGASGEVDQYGNLHTVWVDELGLMYGMRHVSSPVASTSWADRQRIIAELGGNVHMPKMAIDDDGNLHVVVFISGIQPGIYYLNSVDAGKTWTVPRQISDSSVTEWRQGRQRYQLDLHPIDRVVHVVWQQADTAGNGSIVYSRGFDAGVTWSVPTSIQEVGSWPQLSQMNNGDLLLTSVGTDEEGRICMKRQIVSKNLGDSWSTTEIVFDPVKGCLGSAPISIDGDGRAHLVMSAYDSTPIVERIWHAVRDEGSWQNAEELSWNGISYENKDMGPQPDFPSAAITGGNILHAVFMTDDGNIWYTRRKLPASENQPNIYPLPEQNTIESSGIDGSTTSQDGELLSDARPNQRLPLSSGEFGDVSTAKTYPFDPFLVGVIASSVLILLVVLLGIRRRRYHR